MFGNMRRVIVESPFSGDEERNRAYLAAALRDCLLRGEAPLASYGLYTQPGVLDDRHPLERQMGMEAGWAWIRYADAMAVYDNLGLSTGMVRGIEVARSCGLFIEHRSLPDEEWVAFQRQWPPIEV